MNKRYSKAYAATVKSLNSIFAEGLRVHVAESNRAHRDAGDRDRYGKIIQHRVVIRPRLGKNNPARHLYAKHGALWRPSGMVIRREHGTRFDLYVYRR